MELAELKASFDNGFESFLQVVMFIQFVAENASPELFNKKLLSYGDLIRYRYYDDDDFNKALENGEIYNYFIQDYSDDNRESWLNYLTDTDFESWDKLFNAIF